MVLTIRRACLQDAAILAHLGRMDKDPWTKGQFEEEIKRTHAVTYVLEHEEKKGKQIKAAVVVLCLDKEWEILNVLVCPEHRRRGLARTLFQHLLLRAEQASVTAVLLEVRASNIAALALYKKMGFIKVGTRRSYYHQSGEDACVMRLNLAELKSQTATYK